ncbi:cell division protein ZapB [Legionella fairfieldensis]|uniref:cell division protein ZapB n=1 Tax=Legionella fairfieldensis TaxID=45064 RepID=UPI00048E4BB7|nr:cell division protein ZapB [Legionella fairfieldensis]
MFVCSDIKDIVDKELKQPHPRAYNYSHRIEFDNKDPKSVIKYFFIDLWWCEREKKFILEHLGCVCKGEVERGREVDHIFSTDRHWDRRVTEEAVDKFITTVLTFEPKIDLELFRFLEKNYDLKIPAAFYLFSINKAISKDKFNLAKQKASEAQAYGYYEFLWCFVDDNHTSDVDSDLELLNKIIGLYEDVNVANPHYPEAQRRLAILYVTRSKLDNQRPEVDLKLAMQSAYRVQEPYLDYIVHSYRGLPGQPEFRNVQSCEGLFQLLDKIKELELRNQELSEKISRLETDKKILISENQQLKALREETQDKKSAQINFFS